MKKLLFSLLSVALLASCSPVYYQVYQAKPMGNQYAVDKESVVFTNSDCRVVYNLFAQGGDAGFEITNLTDSMLYLHLDESFFILNGMTFDYYRQSFHIDGSSSTRTSSLSKSSDSKKNKKKKTQTRVEEGMATSTASYNGTIERSLLVIPPHSSRVVSVYSVTNEPRLLCGTKMNPKGKKTFGVTFTENDSPVVFSNALYYHVGTKGQATYFSNQFYVSEILNVSKKVMIKEEKVLDPCGNPTGGTIEASSMQSPDRFYVKYRFDKHSGLPMMTR